MGKQDLFQKRAQIWKFAPSQGASHFDGVSVRSALKTACLEMGRYFAMTRHAGRLPMFQVGALHRDRAFREHAPGSRVRRIIDCFVTDTAIGALSASVRRPIRKVAVKVICRFTKKRGKTPAKSCHRTISGYFRCFGATRDCPTRKGQIRLRRSDILPNGKSLMTTTNKGNQP